MQHLNKDNVNSAQILQSLMSLELDASNHHALFQNTLMLMVYANSVLLPKSTLLTNLTADRNVCHVMINQCQMKTKGNAMIVQL
jgi:hypothetical protein